MKFLFENILMGFILALVGVIVLKPNLPVNEIDKPCIIDSVILAPRYSVMPELMYQYHTNCGFWYTSKIEYSKGDTINYNIIQYSKQD